MVHPYLWIVVVGGYVSFLAGAGVGMNDLSNAFGTTYGAKILTLLQIVILASICEFSGAVLLGGSVTSTISSGIADPSAFEDAPYILMYGMLCALGAAFVWLAIATWLVLPVSSTHSICGGVIGFSLVYGGVDAINWAKHKSEFPFIDGVVPIVASWFISPVLTGGIAAGLYYLIRKFVLLPSNPQRRALFSFPLVVGVAVFFESFFVFYKGAKNRLHWSVGKSLSISVAIGVGGSAISGACLPFFRKYVEKKAAAAAEASASAFTGLRDREDCNPRVVGNENVPIQKQEGATAQVVHERQGDSDSDSDSDSIEPLEHSVVREAPIYNYSAEIIYRYLQVFTAVCASFAHGASDVSNSVGPFAAIYNIYITGGISSTSSTPIWILCLGGVGLVVGLSTFGVRLMSLLGEKITLITPTRGFSAELSGALVVSFASAYGIPVSSTHCITGAVVAISILDVGIKNVKWFLVLKMYLGWIGTLFVTGLLSATFFAQGVNAPSV